MSGECDICGEHCLDCKCYKCAKGWRMINKVHEKTIVVMNNTEALEHATLVLFRFMKYMNKQRKQTIYDFMIFTSEHEDDDKRNITIKWSIEKIEPEFINEHLERPTA